MQHLTALISIDKQSKAPVYIQIANQLMTLIKEGTLLPGNQLLSTRRFAESLKVHRRTAVQAYDELLAQGWLESHTGKGTFVAAHLPEIKPQSIQNAEQRDLSRKKAGFEFERLPHLVRPVLKSTSRLHLDDGFPDPRLAPLEDLSRAYRSQLLYGNIYARLGYGETMGSVWLRQELSAHLNETRAMKLTPDNILITRGVVMGVHLVSTVLLCPGDVVAIDSPAWAGAGMNFIQAGAQVRQVPVDEFGLDVQALESMCREQQIRLVYVTPHHHYPTTVALRADRRIALVQLAQRYGFAIFEDDYDYDFHYLSKPLLPLAAADPHGMVLYCGSFTKTIAPAFRIGYLVGPEDLIAELALLRRIVDRQGDLMLENAVAALLQTGVVQRHLRKSVRAYRQRRDHFCELLQSRLGEYVNFEVPDGGMAVWTKFAPGIDLPKLAARANLKGLYLASGSKAAEVAGYAARLGFASSTLDELEESVEIIRDLL